MYQVFLGYLALPVTPSKINTVINGRNETIELLNGQEVNIIKPKGLTTISFEFMIPHQNYPFVSLAGGIVGGALGNNRASFDVLEVTIKKYLDYLKTGETLVDDLSFESNGSVKKGEPFQFIVVDSGRGGMTVKTNLKVTLEDYEIMEDAEAYGLDTMVSVTLKQYIHYSTKILGNDGKIVKARGK